MSMHWRERLRAQAQRRRTFAATYARLPAPAPEDVAAAADVEPELRTASGRARLWRRSKSNYTQAQAWDDVVASVRGLQGRHVKAMHSATDWQWVAV